jgi:hypothetical protein
MKNYLIYDGPSVNNIDWNKLSKMYAPSFKVAVKRYIEYISSHHDLTDYGLKITIKCIETGIIKNFDITANLQFDIMEIVDFKKQESI